MFEANTLIGNQILMAQLLPAFQTEIPLDLPLFGTFVFSAQLVGDLYINLFLYKSPTTTHPRDSLIKAGKGFKVQSWNAAAKVTGKKGAGVQSNGWS